MLTIASSTLNDLTCLLLRLPRELRDLVYAYIITLDSPIDITNTTPRIDLANSLILAELLESLYTHNTLTITLVDIQRSRYQPTVRSIWGAYPQYKDYIRHLEVFALESQLNETEHMRLEHECTTSKPEVRKEWAELLELPHLETLTVNLQKRSSTHFTWANFSPILYLLRERLPRLRIKFKVSFDLLLAPLWNADALATQDRTGNADWYRPAGFVDVSKLIECPSAEDRSYAAKYLGEGVETEGRDAVQGLLWEKPADKRVLAPHYVVKEPALLRVLMERQFEAYKKASGAETETGVIGK